MPNISIIVPVYKVEPYLCRCVDSILAQTFKDFELILVDDGSPDNCGAICDEYAARDSRVHVIHQENGGLSAARNAGIDWAFANSDSEWLTFIDSDDWVHRDYLDALLGAAMKLNVDIAQCESQDVLEGEHERIVNAEEIKEHLSSPKEAYLMPGAVVAMRKLIRRNLMKEIRFPIKRIHEDEAVMHHVVFEVDQVALVDAPLYCYQVRQGSIMHSKWSIRRLDALEALEDQIDYFSARPSLDMCETTQRKYINRLTSLYFECAHSDELEKKRVLASLSRKMRKSLVRYGKALGITVKDNLQIYEVAFPRIMWLYWSIKARIEEMKK